MANIKPFRGYRYNAEKIQDPGLVVSPQYYDLSDEDRIALYESSEYNAVRIISGMSYEQDDEVNNCYTRASAYLKDWIKHDILQREAQPAIYMYEQTVERYNEKYSNRSFVSLLELEDFSKGVIMPCEESKDRSKEGRYNLLLNTNTHTSMISCLYIEPEKNLLNLMNELAEEQPDMEFVTKDNVRERIWVITYAPTINYITDQFKDIGLYIADGQTRYEASLRYRNYMKANNPNHTGKEPYNYAMVSLTNCNSDGIIVRPIHRQIKCPRGFNEGYFVAGAQDHFKIEKIIVDTSTEDLVETMRKQIATKRHVTKIALYCGGNYFYRLTANDDDFIKNNLLPEKSGAYCSLDVTVLNKLILEDLLNITPDNYDERVHCIHNYMKGALQVKDGEYDCIFLINPVKIDQIKDVALAGEKLPENSINISPKPDCGVIFYIMEDDED